MVAAIHAARGARSAARLASKTASAVTVESALINERLLARRAAPAGALDPASRAHARRMQTHSRLAEKRTGGFSHMPWRSALSVSSLAMCASAALLPSPPAGTQALGAPTVFVYTGAVQTYAVPSAATALSVQLWGGGGGGSFKTGAFGGGGAYVAGIVPISALSGTSSLLVAVGGGGPFPAGGASSATTPALGGALRAVDNEFCAAVGAGPSALSVSNAGRTLIAVAGAGGGAGEHGNGGAAAFTGTAENGGDRGSPSLNWDRLINSYNSGGGGASTSAGGAIGIGYEANCVSGTQTSGSGPFSFSSSSTVTVTAGLSLCACGGVGGGGYYGGGPGGWWCGGGGGSSWWNPALVSAVGGAGGSTNVTGGLGEPNYISGVGMGASGEIVRSNGAHGLIVITAFGPCPNSSYSYGSGSCASCPAGATVVAGGTRGCAPTASLTAGPNDSLSFYLSGSSAEGVSAFSTVTQPAGFIDTETASTGDSGMPQTTAGGGDITSSDAGSSDGSSGLDTTSTTDAIVSDALDALGSL